MEAEGEICLAITLIILGIIVVVIGLKQDLDSCRDDRDRIMLGKFLAIIAVLGILVFLCNQWLPSILAWLVWIGLVISLILLVRWLQNSCESGDGQSDLRPAGSPEGK
ncbi:MAG: hypothetical protein CMJ40_08720 [Phycisphaerae bacterium]|nr:hypothetical protein [Phycisphaerae bacterium]